MNIDRLALNLRAYAHSRGAPQREDDQEAAMLAASQIAQAMEARSGETEEQIKRLEGMIVQLGENAAQAAKEYAEQIKLLREALAKVAEPNFDCTPRQYHIAMQDVARQALEATNG